MPGMPSTLSFVQGSSQGGIDPATAQIEALLSRLDFAPPPKPVTVSPSQDVLGSLGDALASMASVRAGGLPEKIGAFAQSIAQRRSQNEKEAFENARADRALKNQIRIGLRAGEQPEGIGQSEVIGSTLTNIIRAKKSGKVIGKEPIGPEKVPPLPASEENVTLKEVEGGKIAKYDKKGNFMGYATGPSGQPQLAKISEQDKGKAEAIKQLDTNIDAAEQLLTNLVKNGETFRTAKANAAHYLPQTIAEGFKSLDPFTAYEGLRQDIGAGLRPLVGVQNMRNIQEIDRILRNVATGAASPERIHQSFERVRTMRGAAVSAYLSTRPQIAHYLEQATPPHAGRTLQASDFDRLPANKRESEKKRFVDAGGTIEGE